MASDGPAWVWIDLEMTGLDPGTCTILEIASIVTDADLTILEEGPDLVIHHSDLVLATMSPWCIEHHGASGLTAASRASNVSLREAEERTLEVIRRHVEAQKAPLCGNSVALDWRFLRVHMPELWRYLDYRLIDVTTVKELAARWFPNAPQPAKAGGHRALADIRESIDELRLYRTNLFRAEPEPASGAEPTGGAGPAGGAA
ncbi:MAG: oligoribonuclease [Sandaracinaceae bacterium]